MTRALLLALAAATLAACGRPGPVRPPGPREEIIYPRIYPYEPRTNPTPASPASVPPASVPPASISPVPGPATPR